MTQPKTTKLEVGQRVRIAERPARTGDQKTIPYYPFYSGLTGAILHSYPDESSTVDIDRESLPVPIKKRHDKSESQLREKWLGDSAEDDSGQANQASTGRVRNLHLRYTLLVANADLIPISAAPPAQVAPAQAASAPAPAKPPAAPAGEQASPAAHAAQSAPARPSADDLQPRLTLDEIEGKEDAYLEEIKRRSQGQ